MTPDLNQLSAQYQSALEQRRWLRSAVHPNLAMLAAARQDAEREVQETWDALSRAHADG